MLLGAAGLRPKKRLGQHFLMDGGTALRIARLAAEPGDRVLEIGAGTGALTAALLRVGGEVTAIEVDRDLVAVLKSREDLQRAQIVEADATEYDYEAFGSAGRWIAAGNLPYNVGTKLLIAWCAMEHRPARIVAMIQRDVADRLTARPGTPQYGSLTVAIAIRARVERALAVSPSQFYPRPKVESSVVVLHTLDAPAVKVQNERFLREVVRAAFAYRRKTLSNSLLLALEIPRERTVKALGIIDIDPEIRGEQLDLAAFAALADALEP